MRPGMEIILRNIHQHAGEARLMIVVPYRGTDLVAPSAVLTQIRASRRWRLQWRLSFDVGLLN